MSQAVPALPEDLHEEIVAYLWDDIPTLKAYSLASRTTTLVAQRLLFGTVILRPARNLLREQYMPVAGDLSGTSADFGQLLARRPHIGSYVRSILIVDQQNQYVKELGGDDVLVNDVVERGEGDLSATGLPRWLPTDEALPRFSPMLRNLNALDISYDGGWHLFSAEVLDSLIDLMQLPSIVHLRVGDQIPSIIFNLAIGPNVKHLNLPCLETCATHRLVQPPRQPMNPVYIESLYIDRPFIFVALLSAPNLRLSLSSLRRLCVHSPDIQEHAKIWQLLQFCLDTMEDFEFIPIHHVGWPTFIAQFEEVIDLGKIVSLKRFTVCISDNNQMNYVPWLNRIISSASGNGQLEELCLKVVCAVDSSNDTWWHGAVDTLLHGEFKSLKRLTVFLNLQLMSAPPAYGTDLYNHEEAEKLRSRRGVVVNIIMCPHF